MRLDAVVIGAGPAGTSAALALAQQGRAVAIVERTAFPRRKVCGEFMAAVNLDLLDRLGVGEAVRALAGPEIRRVALFADGDGIEAPMPRAALDPYGRALGRDVLDTLLLDAARSAGVTVFQPWRAVEIAFHADRSTVRIERQSEHMALTAPVVIAAHGSWEQGKLTTNLPKQRHPRDVFGFKAHVTGASLARDLMPLLVFPGGYGGMVWADNGRLSVSCCVRRDALERLRARHLDMSAGAAVHAHILETCPSAASALGQSVLVGEWMAAGPIRPGMRPCYEGDIFRVGNLAGESHPIIAEGISMALQSGWLLASELRGTDFESRSARVAAGRRYALAYRRQFSTRIRAGACLAHMAIFPVTASVISTIARLAPASLSVGAALTGKTRDVPHLHA